MHRDRWDGALRIADYHCNGSHTTVVGFSGPNAETNVEKWNDFVNLPADQSGWVAIDINCKTKEAIKRCFGLA